MNQSETIQKATKQAIRTGIVTPGNKKGLEEIFNMVYSAGHDKGRSNIGGPKPIVQLNRFGNEIRPFDSASEAGRILGINNRCISAVCRGTRETAGGFKFAYKT